jgi:hypothetical protein
MALNLLSLSLTTGILGAQFMAKINGLTAGSQVQASMPGYGGASVVNGTLRIQSLPAEFVTVDITESTGVEFKTTRFLLTGNRNLTVRNAQADGTLQYSYGLPGSLVALNTATAGADGGSGSSLFRQQIVDRSGLVQATTNVTNASANTQIGDQFQLTMLRDDTEIVVTDGNFYASAPGATNLNGLSNVTVRRGLYDGTTYYPLTFGGSRDMVLTPGQTATWDSLPLATRKGQGLTLISLKTWATAPANFPGSVVPFSGARDLSEQGTTLTDRTTSGGFTAAARVSTQAILPPIAIRGAQRTKTPVVAVMGDSISCAGSADADTNRGQRGYVARGLFAAGVPFVMLGQSSLSALNVVNNAAITAQYLAPAVAAGATHMLLALGTNDFAANRTADQIYTDLQSIATAAKAALPGLKVIVATVPPKTNAANNAQNGSETNTFAQRSLLNSYIRGNKGIGDGFFELAALVQDPANENFWRTDLLTASTITVANGGSNNLSGDLVETDIGLVVQTGGTNGQPATAATIRSGQGGGFLVAPTQPAVEETRQNASLTTFPNPVGSGLRLNVTATTAVAVPTDGIHPSPGMHSYAKQFLRNQAPTLFSL